MLLLVFLQAGIVVKGIFLELMQFVLVGIYDLLVVCLVAQGDIISVNPGVLIKGCTICSAVIHERCRTVFLRILLSFSFSLFFQTFGARC